MKEKIILCEFCPSKGHKLLLEKIYNILSKHYEVLAFAPDEIANPNFNTLGCNYYVKKKNVIIDNFSILFYVLKNVRKIIAYAKEHSVNKIICLTFDDITMFASSFFIPKDVNLFLMHHHNVDSLYKSSFKRLIFKSYSRRFVHIVLCDFIKKFMCDKIKLESNKVLVWPHPSYGVNKTYAVETNIDCVGISGSNDESLITRLIDIEKSTHVFKKNGLYVYLKSKKSNYDDGFLKVFTGYLERNIYDDYIQRARCIFVAFPSDFRYRMSATVMDALCNNKVVIGTKIPIIVESQSKYPEIVKFYSENTFVDDLLSMRKEVPNNNSFLEFQQNHSDELLEDVYSSSINRYLEQFES